MIFLVALFAVKAWTTALPIFPLEMLQGVIPVSTQIAVSCVSRTAYVSSISQFPFGDLRHCNSSERPIKAGARLVIPPLTAPLGGLISGIVMPRWGEPAYLVRTGAVLMFVDNCSLGFFASMTRTGSSLHTSPSPMLDRHHLFWNSGHFRRCIQSSR